MSESKWTYEEIQDDAVIRVISIDEDELLALAKQLDLLDEEDM